MDIQLFTNHLRKRAWQQRRAEPFICNVSTKGNVMMMREDVMKTPKQLGYYFPAEWEPHEATWLSWPHNYDTWPSRIFEKVILAYSKFIRVIAESEKVNININSILEAERARKVLLGLNVDMNKVSFFIHPTNDAWCRDHGPAFLVNSNAAHKKVIVKWQFNSWGEKYPYDHDQNIPDLIAKAYDIPMFKANIIMEGGSVDFNGSGTLLTTTTCLLNSNRNPNYNQAQIEKRLMEYYGVENVLWLDKGIAGDDTDGHIDDITRFVNEDTVITMIEKDRTDENYKILLDNVALLNTMRIQNGKQLNVIEIPMRAKLLHEGQRLPASYANFYVSNSAVIVPTFNCIGDDVALEIIQGQFPKRKIIGMDSTDIIYGLGSFHCLSQQEPKV